MDQFLIFEHHRPAAVGVLVWVSWAHRQEGSADTLALTELLAHVCIGSVHPQLSQAVPGGGEPVIYPVRDFSSHLSSDYTSTSCYETLKSLSL